MPRSSPQKKSAHHKEAKWVTEHIGVNVVPELKRAIQKDLDQRARNGEAVTTTDWLHEAIIKKLQEDNPDVLNSELLQLPKEWKDIRHKALLEKQELLSNAEALSQLKREKSRLVIQSGLSGLLGLTTGFLNSLGFGLLSLAYRPLSRLAQVSRVIEVMEILLNQYPAPNEIRIFPSIPIPRSQPIDLLIIFPNQLIMIVSIRSRTNVERRIKYEPSDQSLYIRHQKRGLYKWSPCPLAELNKYQRWLKKDDKGERFQLSFEDLNEYPIYKVLLLWSPSIIDQESEDFCSTFTDGELSVDPLCVPQEDKTFIIEDNQFYNLVKLCRDGIIT